MTFHTNSKKKIYILLYKLLTHTKWIAMNHITCTTKQHKVPTGSFISAELIGEMKRWSTAKKMITGWLHREFCRCCYLSVILLAAQYVCSLVWFITTTWETTIITTYDHKHFTGLITLITAESEEVWDIYSTLNISSPNACIETP